MSAMAAAPAHLDGVGRDAQPFGEHLTGRGAQDPGLGSGAALRGWEHRIESGDGGRRQGEVDRDDLHAGHRAQGYRGSFTWRAQTSMLCGWRSSVVVVNGSNTTAAPMQP